MSCAATHNIAGFAVGLVATFVDQNPEEERLLLGSILTASALAGAKLPDILEPAIHSHHRKFFHSIVTLVGVACAAKWLWDWRPQTIEQRCLRASVCGLLIGYCSHLGLDAFTPRSLPTI